ncbi:D-alanyl-D-alanine carboxypeptidase [Microbispora cellulosiformans]|uniref:D-alanyl-D-alanine carboxypeptidase n=1 Tax=Microbispora cellulosiformans TaxID=2614688 RepID=A0A5J5K1T1_9ACTN|nr:serine hydrolase [Microbispora cellulosiformans]KAA9378113.1 D-alanyl-D-alanine carboxypeptidase [Microbispora cellulosiformans]
MDEPRAVSSRSRDRRYAAVTLLLCLIVSAVLAAGGRLVRTGAQEEPPPLSGSTPASAAAALPWTLPWPSTGQAAVEIAGRAGSLRVHGEQRPVPIASVTKVMTALVVLRHHPLGGNDTGPPIRVDRQAAIEAENRDESTVPVTEGQILTERQLLELMLIPSGNNAARLLARWDAGSEQAFVREMNAAAARLGMTNTTYTGASGYEPTTVSTAVDQLKLAGQAMKNRVLRDIVATVRTTVPGVPGEIVNSNKLLELPGVVGIKTGTSTPAGGALLWAVRSASGARDRLILGVVLGQGDPGDTLEEKKEAAFAASRELIAAARRPRVPLERPPATGGGDATVTPGIPGRRRSARRRRR